MERLLDEGLFVIKKDGRRQHFSSEKLLTGLHKACKKRPLPVEVIGTLAKEVETELRGGGPEVPSDEIGRLVLRRLRQLDKIAYIRFASVHLGFDVDELRIALEQISGEDEAPLGQASLRSEDETSLLEK